MEVLKADLNVWLEEDGQENPNLAWLNWNINNNDGDPAQVINRLSGKAKSVVIIREYHAFNSDGHGEILAYHFDNKHFGSKESLMDYVKSQLKLAL